MADTFDGAAVRASIAGDERLAYLLGDGIEDVADDDLEAIAETVEAGAPSWRWASGLEGGDNTIALLADDDGGFYRAGMQTAPGSGSKDFSLARHDASGAIVWEHAYGGDERETLYATARASDGAVWIAGKTSSFADYSGDVFLVSVAPDGTERFSKTAGAVGTDTAMALVPDASGGMWAVGRTFQGGDGMNVYLVHADASGEILHDAPDVAPDDQQATAAVPAEDGGFYVAGTEGTPGMFELQPFLARYDANGARVWWKQLACDGVPHPDTIALAGNGERLALAYSTFVREENQVSWRDQFPSQNAFVLSLDLEGERQWRTDFLGERWDAAGAVAIRGDDTFFAYSSASYEPATDNVAFARLAHDGAIVAERVFDSGADDGVAAMAVTSSGMVLLGGTEQPQDSASSQDGFVLSVSPNGRAWIDGAAYDKDPVPRAAEPTRGGGGAALSAAPMPEAGPKPGDVAPEVYAEEWLNTPDGITLADLRGKTVVVEFWATWCGPCRASIPHLVELQDKYEPQGLVFVSLTNEDRKDAEVDDFMAEMNMDYIVGTGSESLDEYGVTGIPTAFVINKEGVVAWRGHPMGGLEDAIVAAL